MKVLMCKWAPLNIIPSWFKNGEKAEVSWKNIEELYELGYSVMIVHPRNDSELALLNIDTKRFTQR